MHVPEDHRRVVDQTNNDIMRSRAKGAYREPNALINIKYQSPSRYRVSPYVYSGLSAYMNVWAFQTRISKTVMAFNEIQSGGFGVRNAPDVCATRMYVCVRSGHN